MLEGSIVADRFRVARLIGKGGMGAVYRGEDLERSRPVALKVSHWSDSASVQRFMREAEALSRLEHRAIVGYVAHGLVAAKTPYLAMEWLDGEDLGQRLARGPLSVAETVAVGMQVAGALAAAHEAGIIHRDLKPGNLFLVDGHLDRLKILDFGLARMTTVDRELLAGEDELLGTRGFIAPEQARGDDIDVRADLYSLGVVLFACLTQRPPFLASHVVGSLATLLFEAVPRVSEVRAHVPGALDELIARLMDKEPGRRVATAAELMDELRGVPTESVAEPVAEPAPCLAPRRSGRRATTGGSRQRFWSVLVVGRSARVHDASRLMAMARRHNAVLMPSMTEDAAAAMYFTDRDLTNVVTCAACCASELRALFAGVRLSLATGRVAPGEPVPVATVVDRAVLHWQTTERARLPAAYAGQATPVSVKRLPIEAAEFERSPAERAQEAPERAPRPAVPLPARFTRMVGRDGELAALTGLLDQAMDESRARLVMVVGEPGIGKSRLAHELLERLRARQSDMRIARGFGDLVHAGTPLGLLRRLMRDAGASAVLSAGDAEAGGAEHEDRWCDWLLEQTARRPLLLMLDDVQWSDPASLRLVAHALRCLAEMPLLIVALGRPEVRARLDDRALPAYREVELGPLSERACAELARSALPDASGADIARVVRCSGGNALHLEELTRRVAAGRPGELPATLAAVIREYMDGLDADAQRFLRTASALGRTFCLDQVQTLLEYDTATTRELMARLMAHQVITRDWRSGALTDREYGFANPSIHEAAHEAATSALAAGQPRPRAS